jgi:hypothetical protein
MIQSIKINWKNCFGIKSLDHEFKFVVGKQTHLIYAPNGTMKTSFAKTMKFLSEQSKEKPCDQLCQDNEVRYDFTVDDCEVPKNNIFVVNGDDELDSSGSFINFLASTKLKAKYDEIYQKLTKEKEALMTKLKSCSQSTDCEKEIVETFAMSENDTIFSILERVDVEVKAGLPFFEFRYNNVFDTKGTVKEFLEVHKENLKEYIENYEKLLSESTLYRSVGAHAFGTYQAAQLSQYVSDGIFFGVQHKIILQNGTEITSHEQLQQIMSNEQKRVLNDEKLKKTFEKITKAIDKNTELRGFKAIIESHPEWISYMLNYETFRKKVWLGYLAKADIKPLFDSYIQVYNENKAQLLDVLTQAGQQQEKWEDIINLYNARFHVPLKVSIANQRDIILKKEAAKLQFSYVIKGQDPVIKEKKELDKILSRGEKRAFIILQFLFEMEARKIADNDSILIMDDIADSFDYQNKYAIVEYIKDLAERSENKFYMLIMTHNYDFYRTVSSRLGLFQSNLWMVERTAYGKVNLETGQYKNNVYANAFVEHDDNDKIFISMIPFVRNLIEYTKGDSASEYLTLTNCLHMKADTANITEEQVIDILANYTLGKGVKRIKTANKIYDLIINTADAIVSEPSPDPVLIENKIVLSIAIRHLAEKYMHDKIIAAGKDENFLIVNGNQTGKWTGKYKNTCPNDSNKGIIERVNMMTPELIHLNSFMFEPLIDMSISHLIKLYKDCKESLI